MNAPQMFARLTKIDEARREVWGRITQEVVDKVDEILDYEKSKPYFKAWSDSFAEATDGKSLGNVRAMHGKVAAGKLIAINFNDAEKAIDVGAKIIDDAEWKKCVEAVYTGFSIGGKYVGDRKTEKMDGRDVVRYVADPTEVSVVDNPCVGPAKFFDIVKADGSTLQKQLRSAVAGGGGDDSGAGPATGAAEPLVVTGTDDQVAEFAKALNDAGKTMADVLTLIKREFSQEERDKAADSGAALPDGSFPIKTKEDLRNAVQAYGRAKDKEKAKAHIIARAKALDAESMLPDDWEKIVAGGDVSKAGFADHVQKMHDMATEMGAECGGKSASAHVHKVDEPNAELTTLRSELAKATERIANLEKQPMPSRVMLRAVLKAPGDDGKQIDPATVELTKADYIINPTTGDIDFEMSRVMKARKLQQMAQAQ